MTSLLLKNAILCDPSQGVNNQPSDLLVGQDGRVAAVDRGISPDRAAQVLDCQGLTLVPGLVDIHTHLREPGGEGSETIATGTMAAAKGGFTTVACMPNTTPVCDSTTGVQFILSRAETTGCGVHVVPIAAVTKGQAGEEIVEFGTLHEAGAGAFSDDGHPVMDAEIMRRALAYTAMLGVPILDHAEDMTLTGRGVMHEGVVSLRLGLPGIPRISESVMVSRDIALAQETGGHIHICHVSTRESVAAIRDGKRNGVRVTAEASPHHLTMIDEAVAEYDTNAKMKPPLNAEEDRQALIAALEDGTLDCIATDHAPHSATSKQNVFDAAPYGILGMEAAFPVLYTRFVVTGQWTLEFLIERMTSAAAKIMNLEAGSLRLGAPADFALWRLGTEGTFDLRQLGSKSRNCPFLGWPVSTRLAATGVGGRVIFFDPEQAPADLRKVVTE